MDERLKEPAEKAVESKTFSITGTQFANYAFKQFDEASGKYQKIENVTMNKLLGTRSASGRDLESAAVFDRKSDTLVGRVKGFSFEEESGIVTLEVERTTEEEERLKRSHR